MSATLGYIILFFIMLVFNGFYIYQIGKIVYGRVQELDQIIKTLTREKKLEEELKLIKSYEVTIEKRLNEIEKAVRLDTTNDNDF